MVPNKYDDYYKYIGLESLDDVLKRTKINQIFHPKLTSDAYILGSQYDRLEAEEIYNWRWDRAFTEYMYLESKDELSFWDRIYPWSVYNRVKRKALLLPHPVFKKLGG